MNQHHNLNAPAGSQYDEAVTRHITDAILRRDRGSSKEGWVRDYRRPDIKYKGMSVYKEAAR